MTYSFCMAGQLAEHELEAELDVSLGEPMVTSGPPERWYPGSGPEIDVLKVWLLHGKRRRLLRGVLEGEVIDRLIEDHEEQIIEKADEACAAARQDAADYRWELDHDR